ncbi:HutD/Ves family protein [Flexivirga caeni]|uniref:HutD family protein n=1 Tax=Flexivirga caeni TaxID=2294115 RepID=A0A3M9M0F4_9MICO|nr:HutD family protein [Flexivirga caeni]RNI19044.1 HutD family protein [Flexivirga caeni]
MFSEPVRFADASTMPWLGGGGVTHELARYPAEGEFGWRLSVAEVEQDGDFSRLAGVDRVIVLCSAGRMALHSAGSVDLQRFSPYAFDGGAEIRCTVPDGPTRDFNVMTRRGRYVADVSTVVRDRAVVDASPGADVFVVCLDGEVACGAQLGVFDLVRLAGATEVDAASGAAAIVSIRSASDVSGRN